MNRTVVISILALTLVVGAAIYGVIVTGQFGSEKAQIAAALDNPGRQADDVLPYLNTIGTARDTVEVMAEYSSHFHSRLVALTGTPEQITQTASVFRIFYGRVSEPEETDFYLMEHSSVIYVIGPDGKYVAHFTHATPMDKMVQRLREIL